VISLGQKAQLKFVTLFDFAKISIAENFVLYH